MRERDTLEAMNSLFDAAGAAAIVRRIQGLRPGQKAQWGKMDVAQMLAHSQVGLKVALGDLRPKRAMIGILFGRLAKRQLASPKPIGKNLPTGPEFRIRDARDFAREQAGLVALVQRFQQGGPAALAQGPHPFFGVLTTSEWDTLQWKHLDHHLRQFGA